MNTHSIPADTILQGDCLPLMSQLPDRSVDLVLCDLPYGVTNNAWDKLILPDRLWQEYRRIVKPAGYVILTAQGLFTSALMESNRRQFSHKIVWIKREAKGFLNAKKMPLKVHEDILVFRMGKGAPTIPSLPSATSPTPINTTTPLPPIIGNPPIRRRPNPSGKRTIDATRWTLCNSQPPLGTATSSTLHRNPWKWDATSCASTRTPVPWSWTTAAAPEPS